MQELWVSWISISRLLQNCLWLLPCLYPYSIRCDFAAHASRTRLFLLSLYFALAHRMWWKCHVSGLGLTSSSLEAPSALSISRLASWRPRDSMEAAPSFLDRAGQHIRPQATQPLTMQIHELGPNHPKHCAIFFVLISFRFC